MKILLALLLLATSMWANVWAATTRYGLPTISVTIPTTTTPTWANADTLRELALAKAAADNLPTVLMQVVPSLSLAQARARASTVAAGTDWLATYTVADEVLTPQYTLRVNLIYNPTKVNALLASPSNPTSSTIPAPLQPSPSTPALSLQTLTLTLEGTPAQGAKLQSILATFPHTTSRLAAFTTRTLTLMVSTPHTASELAQILQAKHLTTMPLTANSLRVVF